MKKIFRKGNIKIEQTESSEGISQLSSGNMQSLSEFRTMLEKKRMMPASAIGSTLDQKEIEDKKKKLKLYIWRGIRTDYTDGIGFAMAYSLKEAKQKIKEVSEDWEWNCYKGELESKPEIYSVPFGAWII